MVRELEQDPAHMVVNRVGQGHWMFLDLRTRAELIVSLDDRGNPRGTVHRHRITPPRRCW